MSYPYPIGPAITPAGPQVTNPIHIPLGEIPSLPTNTLFGRSSPGTGPGESITLGSNLTLTGGVLSASITGLGGGSVTSVGLSLPSLFTVSGSPVTVSGTLTATLATQSANLVLAGPASGGAEAPTFRQLAYTELTGLPTVRTTTTAGLAPALGFDSITYAATVNLDLAAIAGQFKTITLTGDLTLTNSNIAAGRNVLIRLLPGASSRNLTFPVGWVFYSDKPASIAANKGGVLSLTYFGSNDADCVAVWKQQP